MITGVVDHKTIAENLARAGIGETALETYRHPAGMIGMMRKYIPRSEIAKPPRPDGPTGLWTWRGRNANRTAHGRSGAS